MPISREALAEWVGREILPHDRELRLWLRRRFVMAAEVEDIVQDSYCRLVQLSDVDHIHNPRAYLFTVAMNVANEHRRRASVVRLEPLSDASEFEREDPLTPERIASARQDLACVEGALARLSERARRIFVMRKIEGLSQKGIALTLGVTETVVENEASRSLRTVLTAMTAVDPPEPDEARRKTQRVQ